jgi:hypothetical protein
VCVQLGRHWCLDSLRRAIESHYAAAAVVLCSLLLRCRVLFCSGSHCHLYGINATLGEACHSVEALWPQARLFRGYLTLWLSKNCSHCLLVSAILKTTSHIVSVSRNFSLDHVKMPWLFLQTAFFLPPIKH